MRPLINNATKTVSSVAQSASCSHGWLRWVVQCIFGVITITSFILIVYMSMNTKKRTEPAQCRANGCRVVCTESRVVLAEDLDSICEQITLVLMDPLFINSTIPERWLSDLRSNVVELEIKGGNMKYIAPQAFMTTFARNIRRLSFESVSLLTWTPQIFVGLSNLKEISICNSFLLDINENALQAVDDTIEILAITHSDYWDPTNLTGSSNLESITSVILSNNNFNNILNRTSFTKLQKCKFLYLNSCRINAIGFGTFDYLEELEILYLNNNFLVVFPTGLFDNIMSITSPRPRINLLDNFWYCDCSVTDLQRFVESGILLLDPVCYFPSEVRSITFSDFLEGCNNNSSSKPGANALAIPNTNNFNTIRMDGACNARGVVSLISPIEFMSCRKSSGDINSIFIEKLAKGIRKSEKLKSNDLLETIFALRGNSYSMLELATESRVAQNYGLLWFQESCPNEIYCISEMPNFLRVYNLANNAEYTFCPITLTTGEVHSDECIFYSLAPSSRTTLFKIYTIMSYALTTVLCTTIGALTVYAVIRKFPYLLKGSDRILIVKQKHVDALVLPPKLPLRGGTKNNSFDNSIFTLGNDKFPNNHFMRTKSIKSVRSTAPSYISAMQPTEEQLSEWRLRHHFDNNMPYSLFGDSESMYCSLEKTSTEV